MTTYAGDETSYPASLTIPDDLSDEDAASVNVSTEGLADRTAFLKYRSDRIEPLADRAALAAIASPANLLVRLVRGYGMYTFDSSSVLDPNNTFVIAATDATPGRWLWMSGDLVHAANGLARLRYDQQLLVADGGMPTFETPRSYQKTVSLHDYRVTPLDVARAKSAEFVPYWESGTQYGGTVLPVDGDTKFANGVLTFQVGAAGSVCQGASVCLDPYLHDGSTLDAITAWLKAGPSHGSLPTTQASIGIFRRDAQTAALESLYSADFKNDAQATVAAYQAAHALQLVTTQNNVIQRSNYSYFAQVWDEFGGTSQPGLTVYSLQLIFSGITDMEFP